MRFVLQLQQDLEVVDFLNESTLRTCAFKRKSTFCVVRLHLLPVAAVDRDEDHLLNHPSFIAMRKNARMEDSKVLLKDIARNHMKQGTAAYIKRHEGAGVRAPRKLVSC